MKVLVYHRLASEYRRLIQERFPRLEVAAGTGAEFLSRHIVDAAALIAWQFPLDALKQARKLCWIQLTSAGAEQVRGVQEYLPDIVVTNARGIHSELMADYTFGVIVMLHWDFPRLFRNQWARRWRHRFTEPLAGKTLGVVGVGAIGGEIARRARTFGLNVVGLKRNPVSVEGIDRMFGPDQCRTMLALCDFVVLVVPATPETRGMIGEMELRSMKRTAYLINIARGSIVDERALVRALREGWIAGAALDVFDQEPPPADSPLWAMENVIITPHIAGEPANYPGRVMEVFFENVERWREGKPLRNTVDLARGY